MRAIGFLLLLSAIPVAAQEQLRVSDLRFRELDLVFQVTDLSGNLLDVGGKIEEMQMTETPTEIRIDLAADVLFEFDKASLLPVAEETLRKAATFVREQATGTVQIDGHTDSKGDDNYNLKLSRQRAESVRDWFRTRGNVGNIQFSVDGLGEKKPVASNTKPDGSDDPEGRLKNRRVQIVIRKGSATRP